MADGHGGDLASLALRAGCDPAEIVDFSASINPFGPPDFLRAAVSRALDVSGTYPDSHGERVLRAAAGYFGVDASQVCVGNGSEELIYAIPRMFQARRAVIPVPAYIDYERACRLAGLEICLFPCGEESDFVPDMNLLKEFLRDGDLVFLGHPGNPAGSTPGREAILRLARENPAGVVVVDEAYADFCGNAMSCLPELPDNMLVLRSMTKFFAIPGLRAGLCFGSEANIRLLRGMLPCWNMNVIAQELSVRMLGNEAREYRERTVALINEQRAFLAEGLSRLGCKVFSGIANYLLVKCGRVDDGFYDRMLRHHRIALRNCGNFAGLNQEYFRVAVRSAEENSRLLEALEIELGGDGQIFHIGKKRKVPALMFQGTCSNAGKSLLTAAFCRILLNDGYKVAPFKAQNMALNSYVTADGCELGRAQALQAAACRLAPDVRMNPILLKPGSDCGSQVIVMGKATGNMEARRYFAHKRGLFPVVCRAYDELAGENEVMVLEGAGSPGEVNLKRHDIVNMGMARYAESGVLLVGDIDRGGVYASFIGTVETFEPWERDLLKGFVVNKFRGDASLLGDAHRYVEDFTGKPVLGVVDYLRNHGLPEEDSVSFMERRNVEKRSDGLDVALIVLRHISNFTDFDPLELEPDINLRKVSSLSELGSPDLIILPGSKNVIADLEILRQEGIAAAIVEHVNNGAWLLGICGGLQMAGQRIEDPLRLESESAGCDGLGLLPLRTVLEEEKCLKLTSAKWGGRGRELRGYEIHHGRTECADDRLVSIRGMNGEPLGFADGRVWLTYLHGVFDDDGFRREFIDMLRADRGLEKLETVRVCYDMDAALNRLAGHVRAGLDIKKIYKIMGLK